MVFLLSKLLQEAINGFIKQLACRQRKAMCLTEDLKLLLGAKRYSYFLNYQKLQMPSTFTITVQFSHGLDMDMVLAYQCENNFGNINVSKTVRIQKGQIRHKIYLGCSRVTESFQEENIELYIIHVLREYIVTHRRSLLIKMKMMIHPFTKCPEGTKQASGHIKRPSASLSALQKKYLNVPKDRSSISQ